MRKKAAGSTFYGLNFQIYTFFFKMLMIVNIKIPHKIEPIFEGMIRIKLQTPAGLENNML